MTGPIFYAQINTTMKRYYALSEALTAKTIELSSELETGKTYTIEGTTSTYTGINAQGNYEFTRPDGGVQDYSYDDLTQLIDAGDVKTVATEVDDSLSNFPALDKFTRHTFGVPSHELLDLGSLNDTDLYTLEELIQKYGLKEMPLPGEGQYSNLIGDEHWDVLKRYLLAINPEIDLPEELG